VALDPARDAAVRAKAEGAWRLLDAHGFTTGGSTPIVIALDASLPDGTLALSVADAGSAGLKDYAGRPAVLLARGSSAEADIDVMVHELVHIWMRARGPSEAVAPRWTLDAGVASHQSALVHEGVADFVAAAVTQDPVLGEVSNPDGPPRSLRVPARCPGGLTGATHEDALLVSGALWEVSGEGRDPASMAATLAAVATAAPSSAADVATFVDGLGRALTTHPSPLAARWSEVVEARGLTACGAPLPVGATRLSARADAFIAPGTAGFEGTPEEVQGPLAFQAEITGATGVQLGIRSGRRDPPLEVVWQITATNGASLGGGRGPLEGWPSQYIHIPAPHGSTTLALRFVNTAPEAVRFNDIDLTRAEKAVTASHFSTNIPVPATAQPLAPTPPQSKGCATMGAESLYLAPLVWWVILRRRLRGLA